MHLLYDTIHEDYSGGLEKMPSLAKKNKQKKKKHDQKIGK